MRLIIPLPYGELTLTVRRTTRARPLFWYTLLSAALHILLLSLIVRSVLPALSSPRSERQPIIVSISSALRVDRRARPQPARQPAKRPAPRPRQQRALAPPVPSRVAVVPRPAPTQPRLRARLNEPIAVQLQRDSQALAHTAASLSAQNAPLAGIATPSAMPASPKRYALDIAGVEGKPQPEGILYPVKRWTDGAYVYYFVRYLVYYDDGTTETGSVPWPIRFQLAADPFAHGINHMPLPGPPNDYVLPADVSVMPLVRNCYDHRYQYCPIQRQASSP